MPGKETHYDYIIAGAGCAGLSLLVNWIDSGRFNDKKILLIDRVEKKANDRTWCFWETKKGLFEPIVFRSWDHLDFYGQSFHRKLNISPYRYKMIRGSDFYKYCFEKIRQHPQIEVRYEQITDIKSRDEHAELTTDAGHYTAAYIFSSILPADLNFNGYYSLLQHFKGRVIKTKDAVFDPHRATLMDFRPDQRHGTTFVYVLPFSPNEALVEYTLFTADLLQKNEYDVALNEYIKNQLNLQEYEIVEEEFGIIPMTNFPFTPVEGRIINIGTAGGQTKASSGYTFQFIQKHSAAITKAMIATGDPRRFRSYPSRFHFYDSVLLRILSLRTLEGHSIFTLLFRNGDPRTVLKFLDNETGFHEDLNVMKRLQILHFAKSAIGEKLKVKSQKSKP